MLPQMHCTREKTVDIQYLVGREVDILRTGGGGGDVGVKKANGCQAELDSAYSAQQFHSWETLMWICFYQEIV